MPIDIKEIFKSDLDPNSNVWWSKDKLNKLNYNFNLLADGGMRGPVGFQGPDGNMGVRGIVGVTGEKGPIGDVGPTGEDGIGPWQEIKVGNNKLLIPRFQGEFEYQPNRVWIGYLNNEQNQKIDFSDTLVSLKKPNNNYINLRLNARNSQNFDFNITGNNSWSRVFLSKLTKKSLKCFDTYKSSI